MKKMKRYETPLVEFTKFDITQSLMDETTKHPNEGDGDTLHYGESETKPDDGDIPWTFQY